MKTIFYHTGFAGHPGIDTAELPALLERAELNEIWAEGLLLACPDGAPYLDWLREHYIYWSSNVSMFRQWIYRIGAYSNAIKSPCGSRKKTTVVTEFIFKED